MKVTKRDIFSRMDTMKTITQFLEPISNILERLIARALALKLGSPSLKTCFLHQLKKLTCLQRTQH